MRAESLINNVLNAYRKGWQIVDIADFLDISEEQVKENTVRVREEGDSMADKVHCIRKTLRLMPQEAKVLSDKAKANGMNEAEYIRLLISQKPNDYPEVRKLLKELINEINRIGININQIV